MEDWGVWNQTRSSWVKDLHGVRAQVFSEVEAVDFSRRLMEKGKQLNFKTCYVARQFLAPRVAREVIHGS